MPNPLVTVASFYLKNTEPNLAVQLTIEPGWHIYWLNPGDSGLPTTIETESVHSIAYPVPTVFRAPGDIVTYGYTDEVTLFAALEETKPSQQEIEVSWLSCKATLCIPGSIKSTVIEASRRQTRALNKLRSLLPEELPSDITILRNEEHIELLWPSHLSTDKIEIFPDAELSIALDSITTTQHPNGTTTTLFLKYPAPSHSKAVLQLYLPDSTSSFILNL